MSRRFQPLFASRTESNRPYNVDVLWSTCTCIMSTPIERLATARLLYADHLIAVNHSMQPSDGAAAPTSKTHELEATHATVHTRVAA